MNSMILEIGQQRLHASSRILQQRAARNAANFPTSSDLFFYTALHTSCTCCPHCCTCI